MTPTIQRLNRSAVLVAAVLALSGCGTDRTPTDVDHVTTTYVTVPDGRSVLCVVYAAGYKGGIDCDWANAAREGEAP